MEGEVSLDEFNNNARITCREIYTLDQARARFAKILKINWPTKSDCHPDRLKQVLSNYLGGSVQVVLNYAAEDMRADVKLGKNWLLKPSEELLNLIKDQCQLEAELMY